MRSGEGPGDIGRVGYARANEIGSRIPFVIAPVRSSIH